jgi:cytosine/adenosine deaminase-related metal-dependent hydrolase
VFFDLPHDGLLGDLQNLKTLNFLRDLFEPAQTLVCPAAPYTDTNPPCQIDRVFEMAREFDADIDMHLDFGSTAEGMDVDHVCRRTDEYKYGGRVAIWVQADDEQDAQDEFRPWPNGSPARAWR